MIQNPYLYSENAVISSFLQDWFGFYFSSDNR